MELNSKQIGIAAYPVVTWNGLCEVQMPVIRWIMSFYFLLISCSHYHTSGFGGSLVEWCFWADWHAVEDCNIRGKVPLLAGIRFCGCVMILSIVTFSCRLKYSIRRYWWRCTQVAICSATERNRVWNLCWVNLKIRPEFCNSRVSFEVMPRDTIARKLSLSFLEWFCNV